jgi:hypothetical protein
MQSGLWGEELNQTTMASALIALATLITSAAARPRRPVGSNKQKAPATLSASTLQEDAKHAKIHGDGESDRLIRPVLTVRL